MAEYEVVNFNNEDSFESFYKRNKGTILKKLKGKKCKKRHLANARKLLSESTNLPAPTKDSILMEALEDTVSESLSEGFEGDEFDHFRFAKKIRQKAEAKMKMPILRRLNVRNIFQKKQASPAEVKSSVVASNGQLTPPIAPPPVLKKTQVPEVTSSAATEAVTIQAPPIVNTTTVATSPAQETKASTLASNGQLSFPKETATDSGTETSANVGGEEKSGTLQKVTSAVTDAINTTVKKTETPTSKGIDKKWIIGGSIGLILLIIILIFLFK